MIYNCMRDDKEFNNWCGKWEAALKTPAFKSKNPPQETKQEKTDFFGNALPKSSDKPVCLNEVDTKYWKFLAGKSNLFEQDTLTAEPTINSNPLGSKSLKSQRDLPTPNELGDKARELGNTANPVYPSTRGADWRNKVTPEWSDGPKIREIANMYRNLYELQCKLNYNPRFGAFGEDSNDISKIQSQIDEIKYSIDKLSDSLSPDFVSDENS
jgi:hypothetical protein